MNTYGEQEYAGPCPLDDNVHYYNFDLYALDLSQINAPAVPTAEQVTQAVQGHIVGEASIIGSYVRLGAG